MAEHILRRVQIVNASLEEVWEFFASPENLDALTPEDMGFDITTPRPLPKMFPGQIIDYKVSPILNIPLKWRTEIIEVNYLKSFVDFQVKGPYKLWHHTHLFEDLGGKVRMTDIVRYALPLGALGNLAHPIFVRRKLEQIFDYRYQKVEALFNRKAEVAA